MTKEEVLQKVNDYCTEKQYTSATLTDAFKDKFADHFQKAHPDGDINDENVVASIKFSLNTAFSSASELATVKQNEYTSKVNEYETQIETLRKQIKKPTTTTTDDKPELDEEVKKQLKELQDFKEKQTRQEKLAEIKRIAKEGIRQDLHASFDAFAGDYEVKLDVEDKAQAETLLAKYRSIMMGSIGEIKPKRPVQTLEQDKEIMESVPVVKVC